MALRPVDLDLFANSFIKGVEAGSRVPSAFSAFAGGLISGFEQEEKNKAQRIQNELNQNKLDNIEVENRMNEANTQVREAQADLVTQPGYAELEAQKLQNEVAEQQRIAELNIKRTELYDIVDNGDDVASGKAYNSGYFDELFAQEPNTKAMMIERTYRGWEPEDREAYRELKGKADARTWYDSVKEARLKKDHDNEQAFLGNEELADLAEKSKVPSTDFLLKGEVRDVWRAPPRPLMEVELGADGKPIIDPKTKLPKQTGKVATNKHGAYLWEPDPNPDPAKLKKQKAFFIGDEEIGDISDEAAKIHSGYKQTYKYKNGYQPEQLNEFGFTNDMDLERQAEQAQARKAAEEAQAQITAEERAEVQKKQDLMFEQAGISARHSKPFKPLEEVKSTILENRAAPEQPAGAPEGQPKEGRTRISVPTGQLGIDNMEEFLASANEGEIKRSDLGANAPVPSPSWVEEAETKQSMAATKAANILKKYTSKNQTPPENRPPPVEQSKAIAAPSFVPSSMEVNTSSPYKLDIEGIRSVARHPGAEKVGALPKALMVQESRGIDSAISKTKVKGVAQLTEGAALDISRATGIDIDRNDPVHSALGGAAYLETLLAREQFKSNPMIALVAYNAGAGIAEDAIELAGGSTDWNVFKNFIEEAVLLPKWDEYWRRKKVDPKQKAKEARTYPEKVIVNFPVFASSRKDMEIANTLKRQGVLNF